MNCSWAESHNASGEAVRVLKWKNYFDLEESDIQMQGGNILQGICWNQEHEEKIGFPETEYRVIELDCKACEACNTIDSLDHMES